MRTFVYGVVIAALVGCVELLYAKGASVADLFAQAIELGGYKDTCAKRFDKCPMPDVLIGNTGDENILGRYHFGEPGIVRVTTAEGYEPGSLEWNAVVVHEMVHYLQWLTGKYNPGRPDICEMMYEVEFEAYDVSEKYFRRNGVTRDFSGHRDMLKMQYAMCKMAVGV
jgi:hypothetical protein